MQEHTGITCLSTSRSPRPPRARSVPAGPSSQHQGSMQPCTQPSGIVRMSPVSVSATLFADIRDRRAHMDTDPSGRKSSPGCRGGRGGSAVPARRSRAALRGRRVRGMVRHHRWCMARMAEQLFLHGHTTARALLRGCEAAGPLERGERASSATQGHICPILRRRRSRRLRRRLSEPSFDALPNAAFAWRRISPACGASGDFLEGEPAERRNGALRAIFATTRDADTGPIATSRTINNKVSCNFSSSAGSFRARARHVSVLPFGWAWECA